MSQYRPLRDTTVLAAAGCPHAECCAVVPVVIQLPSILQPCPSQSTAAHLAAVSPALPMSLWVMRNWKASMFASQSTCLTDWWMWFILSKSQPPFSLPSPCKQLPKVVSYLTSNYFFSNHAPCNTLCPNKQLHIVVGELYLLLAGYMEKKNKKENPERNKFSIALSALITAITQSQSQTLWALGKMRNSADLLRQSRERRRAFDRNKLSLASVINTLYKG